VNKKRLKRYKTLKKIFKHLKRCKKVHHLSMLNNLAFCILHSEFPSSAVDAQPWTTLSAALSILPGWIWGEGDGKEGERKGKRKGCEEKGRKMGSDQVWGQIDATA